MLVSDWMTPDPHAVSSKMPVMEAMVLLREKGYRRLPVVDHGKLVGIVTDRDLKEATPSKASTLSIYELNYLLSKLSLADVMVRNVITVNADAPLEEAALIMEERKVSGLPAVEGDSLVGILTITDVLKAFVNVLGLREGGTRVSVSVPDKPGVLAAVAEAAAPSNIVAVVTAGVEQGEKRRLVLRVVGEGAGEYPERLKAKGIEIE
ncbi:MAG: CBS domain-containing protein [Deinococcales bacterium]